MHNFPATFLISNSKPSHDGVFSFFFSRSLFLPFFFPFHSFETGKIGFRPRDGSSSTLNLLRRWVDLGEGRVSRFYCHKTSNWPEKHPLAATFLIVVISNNEFWGLLSGLFSIRNVTPRRGTDHTAQSITFWSLKKTTTQSSHHNKWASWTKIPCLQAIL